MKLAQINKHSNGYTFRGLCKRGKSFHLREKDAHISYTTARENVFLIVCFYHVTYEFESESTLYSCLNVKELLAQSRRHI